MASAIMAYDDSRHIPALVAVTVPKMGRMAIHRSEAQQILGGGANSSGELQYDNRSSTSGTSSIGSNSQSSSSTMLTQPSSQPDDECDDVMAVVSPSYTVMSSFPSSQQTTPARQAFDFGAKSGASLSRVQDASIKAWSGTGSHVRAKSGSSPGSSAAAGRELAVAALFKATAAGLSGEERMRAIRAALPKLKMHMSHGEPSVPFKPCLPGVGMPSLDWPDSPEGPWNMSGNENIKRQERRQQAIARWLAADSSDEEDEASGLPGPQQEQPGSTQSHRHTVSSMPQDQHPMVVKALHDRKRKEALSTARLAQFAKQQQQHLQRQQQQHLQSTPPAKRPKLMSRQNSSSKSSRKNMVMSQPMSLTPSERRAAQRQSRRRQKEAAKAAKFMTPSAQYSTAGMRTILPPPPPFHEAPYAHGGQPMPHMACRCGHGDNGAPMVRCDGCLAWHHAACVGIHDASQITQDWLCYACCASDASMVSPSSVADSTAASLMVTPNFPRSTALEGHALRLSQGELPVFSHPSETPFRRPEGHAHHGLSSALALAPSPVMPTTDDLAKRGSMSHAASTSTAQAGRARAARVGWHMQEPGSPLDRKSVSQMSHRRNLSGSVSRAGQKTAQEQHHDASGPEAVSAFLRTPSPRLMQTPSRQRNPSVGGFGRLQSSMAAPHSTTTASMPFAPHRRETSAVRDFDDVFSTPSRMLHGSAWDHGSSSMLRHGREESMSSAVGTSSHAHGSAQRTAHMPHGTPSWGLSTPTRGFVDNSGIFSSSDYSGAGDELPSLVHSSGGVDLGDFASWQHLQGSPTSSTRAGARAAMSNAQGPHFYSGINRRTSSMREGTPDGMSYSADPSSSPFPKTPTFVSDAYGGHGSAAFHASRRLSTMSHVGIPPSPSFGTPSRKSNAGMHARHQRNASTASNNGMLEALGGPLELHNERRPSTFLGNKQQQQHGGAAARNRKVSTDVMAGLGIGLDLNDVLDWQ